MAGDEIETILNERKKLHGQFRKNAIISQKLKAVVRNDSNFFSKTAEENEAIDNILQKIARIISSQGDTYDSWLDIQGYARLITHKKNYEGRTK